jgi:hypothetical protein
MGDNDYGVATVVTFLDNTYVFLISLFTLVVPSYADILMCLVSFFCGVKGIVLIKQ